MATSQNSPKIIITHFWKGIEFFRRLHGDFQAQGFMLWFDIRFNA